MEEREFVAKVQKGRRVAIPKLICEVLKINEGDIIKVKISKEKNAEVS